MQNGAKTLLIVVGSLALGGTVVYLMNKKKAAGPTPPMKVTGWVAASGNGSFQIGPNTGTMNGATGAITQSAPNTYYIDNGGFDGTGWNFNVLAGGPQGALLNTLYVTGNGNWN